MQLVIRKYRPSDKDAVLSLFDISIQEHIRPCFHNAMTSPLHLVITVALCVAGYLLGSVLGALLLPGVWAGFVFYCCHELFDNYIRNGLQENMQDIPGNYLSRPDDCYWVAEAEVEGRAQIVGMVAVVGKQTGNEKYGEMYRMIISPQCRRMGLGVRLTQTVFDFCQERGFSAVILETSSTRTAAAGLYKKMGFIPVGSHTLTKPPFLFATLTKVTVLRMKKQL